PALGLGALLLLALRCHGSPRGHGSIGARTIAARAPARRGRLGRVLLRRAPFAAAILLGAFLVFQIQPLIGKFILPGYGGLSSAWTGCLIFFQGGLLAG